MPPTLRAPVLVPGVGNGYRQPSARRSRTAAELVRAVPPRAPRRAAAARPRPARGDAGAVARRAARRSRSRPTDRSRCSATSNARAGVRVATTGAHVGPARVPRRRRGARRAAGAGQGAGHRPAHARCRARRRRRGCPHACVPTCRRRSTRAWAVALEELVRTAPARRRARAVLRRACLVQWRRGDAPLDREAAIDVLSGALAAVECTTGVHVCGDGDLALALEAGPQVLGIEVRDELVQRHGRRRALPRRRRLDRVGRGADRSTGRRIGRSALARAGRRCGASSRAAAATRCRCARAG